MPAVPGRGRLNVDVQAVALRGFEGSSGAELVFEVSPLKKFVALFDQGSGGGFQVLFEINPSATGGLSLKRQADLAWTGPKGAGRDDQGIEAA